MIRKVLGAVSIVLAVMLLTLAATISHDSPCGPADPLAADAAGMKAIVYRCYGAPDVLKVEDVEKPTPADDEVLVRVRAASVNPLDWHYMRGTPYIMRLDSGVGTPTSTRMGVDFAGTVEAVGRNVKRFRPGDEVFGGRRGAFAEYVTVREDRALALKPANVTFEEAAAVPMAGVTALQSLREKGRIQPGQKVLINGASGGVGTFAVQIAKSFGAEVTGVCSTRNVDILQSLGADHIIDYSKEKFTDNPQSYDLILGVNGHQPLSDYKRILKPNGIFIHVGGSEAQMFQAMTMGAWISKASNKKMGSFLQRANQKDLVFMRE